jgi:galactokinase
VSFNQHIRQAFINKHSKPPEFIVRAPGRVNLIGEHTDYNDGYVLPMAINLAIWIAYCAREDRQVICYSLAFDDVLGFSLDHIQKDSPGWGEYIKGVAWVLQEAGYSLTGWEGVLAGEVPIGAGLSSSAAIEIATLRTFSVVSNFNWGPKTMAKLGQRVEVEWVGVKSGIMDQMISACGVAGQGLLIDCRTLEAEAIPLPLGASVVVLDTNTRRSLVDSAYNERRAQCEVAAQFFEVSALRDVTLEDLVRLGTSMEEITYRRARHVVTENERTLKAAEAMRVGDAVLLGELMNASHDSLRDDFEVSSNELNVMVETAQADDVCYGARMTGAGFGGCAIALVQNQFAAEFAARIAQRYQETTKIEPKIYICEASDGVEIIIQ